MFTLSGFLTVSVSGYLFIIFGYIIVLKRFIPLKRWYHL